jgi:hypothetical protein
MAKKELTVNEQVRTLDRQQQAICTNLERDKYTPAMLGLPEPPTFNGQDGGKKGWIRHENGNGKQAIASKLNRQEAWDNLIAAVDRSKRCKPYDMIQ